MLLYLHRLDYKFFFADLKYIISEDSVNLGKTNKLFMYTIMLTRNIVSIKIANVNISI